MGQSPGLRRCATIIAVVVSGWVCAGSGQTESGAWIAVPDVLCLPGEDVFVRAQLFREGLLGMLYPHIQGELIEFYAPDGKLLASRLTDPTGLARLPYAAPRQGIHSVDVRLADNPRFRADPVSGRIFVRRRDIPMFFVTLEGGLYHEQPELGFLSRRPERDAPLPDCVERAGKIAACSTLVYLTRRPLTELRSIRQWMENNKFPQGPLVFLAASHVPARSNKPLPETHPFLSLRRNDTQPAYLVTGDPELAEVAANNAIKVYLLEGEEKAGHSKTAEEKGRSMKTVEGWKDIPFPCKSRMRERSAR